MGRGGTRHQAAEGRLTRESAHTAALVVDVRCTLGEGPVWSAARQALFWTDIQASTLWMHRPLDEATERWTLPDRLGSLVLCESGKLLLGLAKSLALADVDTASDAALSVMSVADIEPQHPLLRINDGRTDRSGNYVFGTMNEEDERVPAGGFYQFSARHGLRRLNLDPIAIANSICFSLDGGTIYFCDSPTATILCGDYDANAARVSGVREFVRLAPGDGLPDGSIIDSEGCLWNAVWGLGLIRRYRPDGALDSTIRVPAKNPTCPAFGGEAMDRLYVTSSRQEMNDEELAENPSAGGIYTASPGVRGVADALFRGL
jgi:sugar lactone lactonase YvrE